MKKLLLLLAVVGMLAIACEGNGGIEEENGGTPFIPEINYSPKIIEFESIGGETEVTITANFEYKVSTSADWITYTKTENGITVSAPKYEEVKERTAEITISNEKYGVSKNVMVSQAGMSEDEYAKRFIFYTTSDNKVITPSKTAAFGANIVSNTYENGKGIIKFDAPVTSIGESAFRGCFSLTSVTIPDSVTLIGEYAFRGCSSLTSVTIPDSVTSIGRGAFNNCSSLTNVTIPNSVTSIGMFAFFNCSSLTSVTIPDSVTSIGKGAFHNCTLLTSITIPDCVTSIGDSAFSYCSSLRRVDISDLSAWYKIDFVGYEANPLCNGANLYLNGKLVTELTIPSDITEIKNYTFSGYISLTSVTIPDSVTSIGEGAFFECSSLTSITIPESVTEIQRDAFCYCTSLTAFYGKHTSADNRCLIIDGEVNSFAPAGLTEYTIPDSATSIGEDAFRRCESLTSITIPDSVTRIGEYAFIFCSSLTSITIPDSVTSIGETAFYECSSLASVTIGNSVTSIGHNAFMSCSSLASVTIGNSVTSIGEHAFYGCSSLASVTIPDSVTSIGYEAFFGCSSLKSVYCEPTTPPTGNSSMFDDNASSRKIYVPTASVEAYKSAQYWSDYADHIVGYDF